MAECQGAALVMEEPHILKISKIVFLIRYALIHKISGLWGKADDSAKVNTFRHL